MRGRAEVVIVGGGPAGLSTALFLSAFAPDVAARTVLVEKSRYPRDKYCAGGVGARADRLLESVGVSVDVPSVPLDAVAASWRPGPVVARRPGMGRVVRRIEFDAALADAVRATPVEIREGVTVTGITRTPAHLAVATDHGLLEAQVVVGADGVGSFVRRAMGFPRGQIQAQALELDTEASAADHPRGTIHFDLTDETLDGYLWDFPTLVGGREQVCRGIYHVRLGDRAQPVDLAGKLAQHLARRGLDLSRYRKKRFAERGIAWAEPMAAPGVLLVGEAAGIDGLTGEGIAQGIQYGELAGRYLAEELARGRTTFSSWQSFVRGERLGVDLRARTVLMRLFYGPDRSVLEPFLAEARDFYQVGLQVFAGEPVDPEAVRGLVREVGRYVARTGWSTLRGWGERRRVAAALRRGAAARPPGDARGASSEAAE